MKSLAMDCNSSSVAVGNKIKQEVEAQQCVTFTKMEEVEEEEDMYEHANSSSSSLFRDKKKRRLSVEQVKALEKNFEVVNKLDPERKHRIATELALQPRQVAIWFQNRRARWKTKQLERDYGALQDQYNDLKNEFATLRSDKDSLTAEVLELKAKLAKVPAAKTETKIGAEEERPSAFVFKDGASDSDCSVVFNEEGSVDLDQHSFIGYYRPQCSTFLFGEEELMSGEELCSSSWFSEEQAPSFSLN